MILGEHAGIGLRVLFFEGSRNNIKISHHVTKDPAASCRNNNQREKTICANGFIIYWQFY